MRWIGFFLLSSCVIGTNKWPRPRDLSPVWLVDRPRILAIQAEPPEIEPGESSDLKALIVDPNGEVYSQVWFGCAFGLDGYGCPLPSLDLESMGPEELVDAGVIGIEPFLPPVYTADPLALKGLSDNERLEGIYAIAQLVALPQEAVSQADVDFNQVESGFKRIVISEATTANHNPKIASFQIDGIVVPTGAVAHVESQQLYEIGIFLEEETVEEYVFVNSEGAAETRVEEPYASWFSTDGSIEEAFTLYPFFQSSWVAPEKVGSTGSFYVVVRDRRGGVAWFAQPWEVVLAP